MLTPCDVPFFHLSAFVQKWIVVFVVFMFFFSSGTLWQQAGSNVRPLKVLQRQIQEMSFCKL